MVSCEHEEKHTARASSERNTGAPHGDTLGSLAFLPSLSTSVCPLLSTTRGTRGIGVMGDLRGTYLRDGRLARRGRDHRNRVL